MPYLLPTLEGVENVPGGDVLVVLTSEEHRALLAIAPQLEWINDYPFREWMESATVKLIEAIDMDVLVSVLQQMAECLCALQVAVTSGNPQQWTSGNPEFRGVNIDKELGETVVPENGLVPESIAMQNPIVVSPETDWGYWREYVCRATNFMRISANAMLEEMYRALDLPVLTVILLAGAFGAISLLTGGLTIILGITAIAGIASAMLAGGVLAMDAARDFLLDTTEEHWGQIACIMSNAASTEDAEYQIKSYIEQNAPPIAVPLLLLFPWLQWARQIWIGENTEGQPLIVMGQQDLCQNCAEPISEDMIANYYFNEDVSGWYMRQDSPCQVLVEWLEPGRASLSCHVPFSHVSHDFVVLGSDVGNPIEVTIGMSKAGSASGSLMWFEVQRVETETRVLYQQVTNTAGYWSPLPQEFVPAYAGTYRLTLATNNELSWLSMGRVRRTIL